MPSTGTILVVEHDPAVAAVLLDILTYAGYVAYAASNATEALHVIASHSPTLVMLDTSLRSSRTIGLITTMRAAAQTRLAVILMTTTRAVSMPSSISHSIGYLSKPFEMDALLACVSTFVLPQDPIHANN